MCFRVFGLVPTVMVLGTLRAADSAWRFFFPAVFPVPTAPQSWSRGLPVCVVGCGAPQLGEAAVLRVPLPPPSPSTSAGPGRRSQSSPRELQTKSTPRESPDAPSACWESLRKNEPFLWGKKVPYRWGWSYLYACVSARCIRLMRSAGEHRRWLSVPGRAGAGDLPDLTPQQACS